MIGQVSGQALSVAVSIYVCVCVHVLVCVPVSDSVAVSAAVSVFVSVSVSDTLPPSFQPTVFASVCPPPVSLLLTPHLHTGAKRLGYSQHGHIRVPWTNAPCRNGNKCSLTDQSISGWSFECGSGFASEVVERELYR